MLEITHYDSLDIRLENGPPLDALCEDCKKLNFDQLFSGPRYEDFDIGHSGDKELDVSVGIVGAMRLRANECRVCHILIAFHDALHTVDDHPWGPDGCDEKLEKCILKPYRTDAVLHMADLSKTSSKNSIATALALKIQGPQKRAETKKEKTRRSEGLGAENGASQLPWRAYSCCNFLLSLTSKSCIEERPVLSLSNSAHGSDIDWVSLRAWVEACEADHPMCRSTSRLFADKGDTCIRCVDVETSALVPMGPETQYIALSYVWGITSREMKEHMDRCVIRAESTIVSDSLPETLRDAVQITKKLGERYLWIDCLCINQDDAHELSEQITLMDRIFANAYMTVVPIASANVCSQIPGLRSHSRVKSTSEVTINGRTVKAMCANSVVSEFIGPWMFRGWTYQEWLLSRRCLFFSDNQILFGCQFGSGLESFVPPKVDQFPNIDVMPRFWAEEQCHLVTLPRLPLDATAWNFETYAQLVGEYTQRSLSKQTDILRAFAGLMSKLEKSTGMTFVEGMPVRDLLNALTWTLTDYWHSRVRRPRWEKRPSWSWASWTHSAAYLCWQLEGSPNHEVDFIPSHPKVNRGIPSETAQVENWVRSEEAYPKPVAVSIRPARSSKQNTRHRAYQLRRADLILPLETDGSAVRSLLVSTETRSVLVRINAVRTRDGWPDRAASKNDVLHPGTEKVISASAGRLLFVFSITIASSNVDISIPHDAILLYEWKIERTDGQWYDRVLVMIISRLADGTVERVGLVDISSHDWYSLPLVKEAENLVLV